MSEHIIAAEQISLKSKPPTERGSQLFWRGFQEGFIWAFPPSILTGVLLGIYAAALIHAPINTSTLVVAGIGIGIPLLAGIVEGVGETVLPGGRR
jgi:hypothetical protein